MADPKGEIGALLKELAKIDALLPAAEGDEKASLETRQIELRLKLAEVLRKEKASRPKSSEYNEMKRAAAEEAEAELAAIEARKREADAERRAADAKAEEAESEEEEAEKETEENEEEAEESSPSKLAKAKAAAGAVLGVAGKVGHHIGRVGRGVGNAYNYADQKFQGAQSAVIKGAGWADDVLHPALFALFTLLVHLYDGLSNFSTGAGHRSLMLILYVAIALWAIFFFYRTGLTQESGKYVGISILAWALPYLRLIPFLGANDYFTFLLFFLPVWFLYIAGQSESKPLRFIRWLLILFLVLSFVALLLSLVFERDMLPDARVTGEGIGGALQNVFTDLRDAWARIKERLGSSALFNPRGWKQKLNETFNPTMAFYAGQVEENNDEPTGVYITELKSLYEVTPVGTEPVIRGTIEAVTFLPYTVHLSPHCRLERPGGSAFEGESDPPASSDSFDLNRDMVRDVLCSFPTHPNMTEGNYDGILVVQFPYETWSYITQTFVSRETVESYLLQGRDINSELGIDERTSAIYTNGPVEIGVDASRQPIDINLAARDRRYIQQHFGFSVANRWSQGSVKEVSEVVVMVPEPFELKECLPTKESAVVEGAGHRNYTFTRGEGIQLDARLDYRTITCQLVLPTEEDARKVLSYGEKTPVTFVVIAKYLYELEEKVPVRIGD